MRHFRPPQKRVSISFRIDADIKERLQDLIRVWRVMAEESGSDPDDVDLSYVCDRLLTSAVEEEWAETVRSAGLKHSPTNAAEWSAVEHAAKSNASKFHK